MDVEIFCTCNNSYYDTAKRLNIKGVFDRLYADTLPEERVFYIALRLRFQPEEAGDHTFRIVVREQGCDSIHTMIDGEVPVPEPSSNLNSSAISHPFKLPIKFNKYGAYTITLYLDDIELKSIPIVLINKSPESVRGPYSDGHKTVIESLQDLITKIERLVSQIKDAHSNWNENTDSRIAVFNRLKNNAMSAQLALVFSGKHLSHDYWWEETIVQDISESAKKIHSEQFDMFYKIGFFQLFFSNLETGLRNMLKAIDPKACNGATDPFKNIYDHLLKSRLDKQYQTELLDLYRLVRNTIHNNGFYNPRSGKNQTISYNGTKYEFIVGQQVNFVDWKFIVFLSSDVIDLLYEIVTDPKIESIKKEITSPASIN